MLTTRDLLRLAALVMGGSLPACTNDFTAPVTPPAVAPTPVAPARVFASLEVLTPSSPMAPIALLNTWRIEVRAKDQHGARMIVGKGSFTIASSNPMVATVSEERFFTSLSNGVPDDSWISAYVRAIAPGEAVITVSWTIGEITKTAKSTIRVESIEGWSLKVNPASLTVKLGSTERVHAMLLDATGRTRIRYAGAFTADRDDVVAVFADDWCCCWPCEEINVRGVGLGEATLTAKFEGLLAKMTVTVVPSD